MKEMQYELLEEGRLSYEDAYTLDLVTKNKIPYDEYQELITDRRNQVRRPSGHHRDDNRVYNFHAGHRETRGRLLACADWYSWILAASSGICQSENAESQLSQNKHVIAGNISLPDHDVKINLKNIY